MTLAMQFPAQLRQADHEAYAELLNNVSTIVTGNVAVDDDLAKRLATEDMPPGEVANRLRGLHRGQWFASLPSEFGVDEPRPFLLESAPIPAGHPESDDPLSSARQVAFDGAMDFIWDRSRLEYGLDIALQSHQSRKARHQTQSTATDATASENMTSDTDSQQAAYQNLDARIDSALPYTERLPDAVEYDAGKHALLCANCQNRFASTIDGMRRAIGCCDSLDAVSRDEVPFCELNLKLSVDERRQSPYTVAQLRFLQAVHLAHQQAFDEALEYDLVYDSMVRLQEYVGISHSELQELLEAGVIKQDCSYPHKL